MDRASKHNYKQLLQAIKILQQTKQLGISFKKIENAVWTLECYSDSDYGGDTTNRK